MAIAMLGLTERASVPFISTEGSTDIVTPVADRQWTFKSTADDEQVMERLADYFAKKASRRWPSSATRADSGKALPCS